jgi:preprotein translocase subunit SecG
MITVLLIIHVFVTLALIGVVLIQRSEGGGLGIGSSQGMGSFMSGRGTANLLTRTTAILATLFMVLSLALALLNRGTTGVGASILDQPPATSGAPSGAPVPPTPETRPVPAPTTAPPPSTVPGASPSGTAPPPAPRVAPSAGGTAPTPSTGGAPTPAPAPAPAPGPAATPAPAPASGGPSVPTN